MPPQKPHKQYFYYGHRHRNPHQHRPTVYGGFFTNRRSLPPPSPHQPISPKPQPFLLHNWDPDLPSQKRSNLPSSTSDAFFSTSLRLSPIARFIVDVFRKNQNQWGPPVISELNKLRRVTPDLVAEVLKASHRRDSNPILASKFFYWAGKQKGFHHTFASYNAFAYCLNRHNRFRAADQIPELMDSQGKPPSEKQFEILIRMHCDANRGLRVYYVYEKMKKFGVVPRVFLYNRILDALVKTDHLDLALTVYRDFQENGLVEESITFMILIKGLCKAGRVDEMLELLARMRATLCKPDVFAYTAMVKVFVSKENLEGCLRVWDEMRADRVEPDVMAYGTLIIGLCKVGRAQKGYELFQEMKGKRILIDRAIYGTLIEAFVQDEKVGLACDLYKDLVDSGYRADLGIYHSLIKGLCNLNQVHKAYKLFQLTIREDLKPDFETVKPIMMMYVEMGRMDDLWKLVTLLQKLEFSVDDVLSKFLCFMVEEEDKISVALDLFHGMIDKGYGSVALYNVIMGALHRYGQANKALEIYNDMKNSNIEPDSTTYSIAVLCFVEIGKIREACASHNKIIELGSVPSMAAYCSLSEGLFKICEIDAVMMLVRDCLANVESGPQEFKYALTIVHACKSGKAEMVIDVLKEMVLQDCAPSSVAYSAIISGMSKYGTFNEAKKVFLHLRERSQLTEANCIVCEELLIEHMKKKTADLVRCGLKFFNLESRLKAKGCNLLST
ncbi:pentatricopeptide repeat-containing protein [Cucumis melo var. makuwa]|uniref:Pentatricopeptide repeat-containing protein n=1 Tax=Cucumis melo var. makuwa TaxID=1194695 RepID=A0A5D3BGR3_CUCMM|nr:pentatricopeptide repeat-containing protein [Cucumis melo var. makuwa]TYJ98226.1 pentatricopeptide repeat-containing protein [Cucumis melo var. makuwa]